MSTANGLENVVAAETVLSHVDGEAGQLVIRGETLDSLVRNHTYESATHLLLEGFVASLPARQEFAERLGAARRRVFIHLAQADKQLLDLPPVEAVRALMARIPDGHGLDTTLGLMAAPAVFLPGILRLKRKLKPVEPRAGRGHAEDILFMLTDARPSGSQITALDRYLMTIIDHSLNASTFTARVVASTGAGLTSSILAAYGALTGPLHGGAPGPVLDMLDEIGTPGKARPWIEAALARGDRLMGFGHRIYRVRDPRADALKSALSLLGNAESADPNRLVLAAAVEDTALQLLARKKPDRPVKTNVEFYTALLLEALGFPRTAFTAIFATGRVAGWLAHAGEQAATGRLIRPAAAYIGPVPRAAA